MDFELQSEPRLTRRRWLTAIGRAATGIAAAGIGGASAFVTSTVKGEEISTLQTAQVKSAIEKGLDYLARKQDGEGGFGAGSYSRNVGVVGLIATAFMSHGDMPDRGPRGRIVSKCTKYVLAHAKESGFINAADYAGYGPMYGHGFATLFLAEVYGMSSIRTVRTVISRAVRLIVDCQNREGGWRYQAERREADISVTICQMMALRAARNAGIDVPSETIERCLAYVRRCQNADGGFMYQLAASGESEFARTAGALAAFYGAGVNEGAEIDAARGYLKKSLAGTAKDPSTAHFWYGHYYAAQALRRADSDDWAAWYGQIRDVILPRQRSDGSWEDDIGSEYATAMACHFLQMPSTYLPLFQR